MTYHISSISEGLIYPFIFVSLYFQVFMLYNFLLGINKMKKEEEIEENYFGTITFMLPGWNEGRNIVTTIRSIQDLDYPKDKISIYYLDNNSTDNTRAIVEKEMKGDARIKYFFETKQGKHHAMNLGLLNLKTEYMACLDVDSTLHARSLVIAMQYFKNREISALATCMQLREVKTFWQRVQAVEYMVSIFWRKSYSNIDAVQVMPGPFSVFRSEVFTKLGNYKNAHNAEDFEMTLRLHKNNYKIANAHKAYVYTIGPDTFSGLIKQRVRWIQGFLHNAWDYKDMFFKKKYGHFGLFTLPIAAIFIFYVLYAVSYSIFRLLDFWIGKLIIYSSVGLPKPNFNFDPFYFTADVLLFQSMFILTVLVFILFVSKSIAEDKTSIFPNFPIYFLAYPFIAPIFIFIAVFKFLFVKENKWIIQDNKL
jgi:cellulose synthase/poly-beta-1,6-N-acetylglucosamine synthase-like glycosyltransferase